MPGGSELEIDVLDLMDIVLPEYVEQLEAAEPHGHVAGQLAYLRAVQGAIEQAAPGDRPVDVFEQAAREVGLWIEDGQPMDLEGTVREAGILSTWGFCLGFVEGTASGARAVARAVGNELGSRVEFGTR